MKSILKTFNAGLISKIALISMSSLIITACGGGAETTNPRAYDEKGPEININSVDTSIAMKVNEEDTFHVALEIDSKYHMTLDTGLLNRNGIVKQIVDVDGEESEVATGDFADTGAIANDVWDGKNISTLTTQLYKLTLDDATCDVLTNEDISDDSSAIISDTLNSSMPTTYCVLYTSQDASGNISHAARTVEVADRTSPEITISGDNPLLAPKGVPFTAPAATSYDAFDDKTIDVTDFVSDVDTNEVGTYTVTYSSEDETGNLASKTLTVIVEPSYAETYVVFQNGSLTEGWRLNGYDQDKPSFGDCPDNSCPNLDFGMEMDADKGYEVFYVDHGIDNTKQAGFFLQTSTPVDLRGATENGKLSFEIWSDSPEGVDLNVAVDCPAYPDAGDPTFLEGVGAQQWQEISIPASALFNNACSLKNDQIGTIPMFLQGWIGPKFKIDNVVWSCETTCDGTDIPDKEYTSWEKVAIEKGNGYKVDENGDVVQTSYPGYNLVWFDEFNGTEVDTTKWNLINAGGGFGNEELQYYRSENASVENGYLVITADIQQSDDEDLPGGEIFSSAKLTTQGADKFEFKHGRVDIRAAVAEGKGMWSAGWMLGANVDEIGWPFSGEIDIFETIGGYTYDVDQENRMVHNAYWNTNGPSAPGQSKNPREYDSATYSPTPNGSNPAWGERVLNDGNTFSDTFHVFSIEWDEKKIRYMIDGEYMADRDLDLTTDGPIPPCVYGQVSGQPEKSCVGQSFNNDFFLILNVAVGGTFPGMIDDDTQFPRGMLVDYVRVYQTAEQQAAQ